MTEQEEGVARGRLSPQGSEHGDLPRRPLVHRSVLVVEQATVYRGGRRRYFTKAAALKGYASLMYRTKHPCECEQPEYDSGYPGYNCAACLARDKIITRYLRALRRRERQLPAAGESRLDDPGTVSVSEEA